MRQYHCQPETLTQLLTKPLKGFESYQVDMGTCHYACRSLLQAASGVTDVDSAQLVRHRGPPQCLSFFLNTFVTDPLA